MTKESIRFTKHAMDRARQRKLWKYVNKKTVFYEAEHLDTNRAQAGNCIYVTKWIENKLTVITMYQA